MRFCRRLASLAPVLVLSAAHAQNASTATLSVRVKMVSVDAVVRDQKGELLPHLEQKDFAITEDGKPQQVRYFNRDSDLPIQMGLLIDVSGSQTDLFPEEHKACEQFLHTVLTRPGDNAFIVQVDSRILLLQKPTSSVLALDQALTKLTTPHHEQSGVGGGTLLWDSVVASVVHVTGRMNGRHAIIMLTDGGDYGSKATVNDALTAAQLSDTIVYTIYYSAREKGPEVNPSEPRAVMQYLADSTGGRLFVVSKAWPLERIFAEIEAEMRSQYRIGYAPPDSKPAKYHRIEVKTLVPHATVQVRTGYFTPLDENAAAKPAH